jgi:hypothetical protein
MASVGKEEESFHGLLCPESKCDEKKSLSKQSVIAEYALNSSVQYIPFTWGEGPMRAPTQFRLEVVL